MINIFSIILIILITLFIFFFKRNNIINLLNNKINSSLKKSAKSKKNNINLLNNKINSSLKKSDKSKENNIYLFNGDSSYSLNNPHSYSKHDKKNLRKEMIKLFKGSRRDKLKALHIAEALSDKTTLKILRIGLKDMDPDVVKRSAILIRNFK